MLQGWVMTLFFRGFGLSEKLPIYFSFWSYTIVFKYKKNVYNLKPTKNVVVFGQVSHSYIFILKILSTYMTMAIIVCDYQCGKHILDIAYSSAVTYSTIGSSHTNSTKAMIGWEGLAWNYASDKQRWTATLIASI